MDTVAGLAPDSAAEGIRLMANDRRLFGLVVNVLAMGWEKWRLPAEDLPALMRAAVADPCDATAAVYRVAPYLTTRSGAIARAYAQARAAKFDGFAEILAPLVRPGLICDMGAGDTQLVQRLSVSVGGNSRLVATDIAGTPKLDGAVSFALQPAPHRLPLPDNSASTVIATGMLHHMEPEMRRLLLDDVRRVLEPGGTLLLLEDTYPATDWAPHSEVDACFRSLDDRGRWGFLAVTDWWGNRVMKNLADEPLPCTFMNMAGLERVIAAAGLTVCSSEYLGVVDFGGHMATPRALTVATS
ncbi:MAG: class I SAM-dependent methyltransferase [Mycolicibacterium sp.]|uniref:class I SAM-dependent methyltransferase n=1 Tax=Mycolicibacterium sp. TaxID=2320850 RepID=UPI003D0B4C20